MESATRNHRRNPSSASFNTTSTLSSLEMDELSEDTSNLLGTRTPSSGSGDNTYSSFTMDDDNNMATLAILASSSPEIEALCRTPYENLTDTISASSRSSSSDRNRISFSSDSLVNRLHRMSLSPASHKENIPPRFRRAASFNACYSKDRLRGMVLDDSSTSASSFQGARKKKRASLLFVPVEAALAMPSGITPSRQRRHRRNTAQIIACYTT